MMQKRHIYKIKLDMDTKNSSDVRYRLQWVIIKHKNGF